MTDNPNQGHRERLRERFMVSGHASLADHELLELLLFGVVLRRDAKPIAKALLARFKNLNGVLGAPLEAVKQVEGVGEAIAIHLKAVHAILVRSEQDALKTHTILDSWSNLLNYVKLALANETREQFRVLFLDKKLKLQSDELFGDGTIDHAPVYPREIARRALELASSSVILLHNHPSGDPKASNQDIAITRKIILALGPLEVNVIDHLIVGAEGTTSMKALGLI
ncbi:MAG: radC [Hyphomonadaceae bacterium]|nr:MAG: radC [Hyphomonadaceae bacterium]KAF0186805.1 MAG: radC [Hyphomonadaceae bacterium]